jgi:hypothetical protein
MSYQHRIVSLIPNLDPRHVEAQMRIAHGTLDALDPTEFSAEARKAAACVDEASPEMSEQLARSFGL